jgi:hypothetical protein
MQLSFLSFLSFKGNLDKKDNCIQNPFYENDFEIIENYQTTPSTKMMKMMNNSKKTYYFTISY